MTPIDFVIWLKGFIQASSNFTLTPKQFDDLKEQLDKVNIENVKPYWTVEVNNSNTNNTNQI